MFEFYGSFLSFRHGRTDSLTHEFRMSPVPTEFRSNLVAKVDIYIVYLHIQFEDYGEE